MLKLLSKQPTFFFRHAYRKSLDEDKKKSDELVFHRQYATLFRYR